MTRFIFAIRFIQRKTCYNGSVNVSNDGNSAGIKTLETIRAELSRLDELVEIVKLQREVRNREVSDKLAILRTERAALDEQLAVQTGISQRNPNSPLDRLSFIAAKGDQRMNQKR